MGGYARSHYPLSPAIRRGLSLCASGGLSLALLVASASGWAATYRWVDDKGRVHYGDSIPPQYSGRGYVEMSSQGRVVKRVENQPSSAEARAQRELETKRKAEEARAVRERQLQDSALLATYRSPADLDLAKQRALEVEQELLDNLIARRKLSQTKSETRYLEAQMVQRLQNLEKLRTKYDADKARYIELTGKR